MSDRWRQSVSTRLAIATALLLALALSAAGCGGDDADAGGLETSSLGKKQYVKQADLRCAEERRDALNRLTAYVEKQGGGDPEQAFEVASRRFFAASLERQADAIRDLGAPEGDEEQIEALLVEMQEASASLVEDPVSDFRGYGARLRPATTLAVEYGFTQCASAVLV